jgi:hypothetical protein
VVLHKSRKNRRNISMFKDSKWVEMARKELTREEFELFVERSAIKEFEGGTQRDIADKQAYAEAIEQKYGREKHERRMDKNT